MDERFAETDQPASAVVDSKSRAKEKKLINITVAAHYVVQPARLS